MANTYTQLYIHYVFAVQNRLSLINDNWQSDLYKYMNGIIEQQGHKPFVINGMPDHVHVLVSMSPKQAPSDLMFHIKRSSSLWINKHKFVAGIFSWQEGFGAFTYGKSQLPNISRYIDNQQKHHQKHTFYEEYLDFLKAFEIKYDERYIFKPID
ncbi:IS200/IS605 family transposase [Aquipluma nitroreducens]|uniref:IS200/IS605 family transposase n=1 Tax=Aquipluma nitroreducens TaxID=2010828 RepID=UPI00296F873A|nr:IS200/IS605 family transposase [Aquipluma nitroreducens]